ncbi:MAG: IclR family transcriptional regulator [Pseudomonadota bacterium]
MAPRTRTSGIDRAIQVMDILTERQMPMTAYDLAKSTGAPVSTIYRVVDELIERDMLSRSDGKMIWLGPRLMRYGLVYRSKMDMFAEAKAEMRELSRRTGETVQVCARDDMMMVVIAMAVGEGHFRVTSDVGTRVPLNWTASGRLLLGHLPEDERLAIFKAAARPSQTGIADIDPIELSRQSREDYTRRLALQMGNSEYSVACIAAPIRDIDGACVSTMSIVLPEQRVQERLGELTIEVQRAAELVERALGRKQAA